MHDAVVIGGGIAGLTAAWELRHRDVVLLEASDRVGGRIRSERRGHYWLNFGAHVFGGADTATGKLIEEAGVEAMQAPGRLTAVAMNGATLTSGRVETYPFRIPMSWRDRSAAVRAGAKVRLAVLRYGRVAARRPGEDERRRQQRMYDFMPDRSFADFVGRLPVDADALFRPTVSRSAGDPEELSAGAGVGYFHLVWNAAAGLSRNVVGGSSTLTDALAHGVGAGRVRTGARAVEVRSRPDRVEVTVEQDGQTSLLSASHAVLATPAYVTAAIAPDLDADVLDALRRLVYGPYLVVSFLTAETSPQAWDDCYAIATPKRPFNMVFNTASVRRGAEPERLPGGSLMAYSGGRLARPLLERDDGEVIAAYLLSLDELFPGFSGIVEEARVQRWPQGLPYCFPGRNRLQPTLLRPQGRVFLAGDFLGTWYTETAIQHATAAAHEILRRLEAAA